MIIKKKTVTSAWVNESFTKSGNSKNPSTNIIPTIILIIVKMIVITYGMILVLLQILRAYAMSFLYGFL